MSGSKHANLYNKGEKQTTGPTEDLILLTMPFEFVFQIANNYPHYFQIDGVDTETNIPILKPTDLFSFMD